MSDKRSPFPPGVYVELDLDAIEDGRFRREFQRLLRRGLADYLQWEKAAGRTDGSFTVSAKVTVSRVPNTDGHFALKAGVSLTTPAIVRRSLAKLGGGRLLCQPEGASGQDPDQINLFDGHGNPKGAVDPATGELIEHDDRSVAGNINTA